MGYMLDGFLCAAHVGWEKRWWHTVRVYYMVAATGDMGSRCAVKPNASLSF